MFAIEHGAVERPVRAAQGIPAPSERDQAAGGDEELWRSEARCADGVASLTPLFFSESLDDIARAKAFCRGCAVQDECLASAIARHEPWGVWGGELLVNGKVIANKRKRGRPPKHVRPQDVLPTTWELPVEAARKTA